jgi:predicted TIM-barrel fold metal-dependent hydrolase
LGVAAAAGAAAWRYWPEQGFWNPCHADLPRRLAGHELVQRAWEGIDPAQVWDSHAHLIGTGDSGSGVFVHPGTESLLNPGQYARRLFFLNAGCVHDAAAGSVDRAYVERMQNLVGGLRPGCKLLLFAFERAHDERGEPDPEHTMFHVPDAYARDVAKRNPDQFEWAASIHPYRQDALAALEQAKREGARAVKWLPSAMGIDPASPKCDRFYEALSRHGLPLIAHAGEERAVLGREAHDFGNPLRLRRALDAGVRVVIAHCASIGEDRDLDRGPGGPYVDSFSLFVRVFEKYASCYGDISAMTQVNRAGAALARVVENERWHARLLNGSDYPLPGVMPIFSVDYLVSLGMIAAPAADVLREIRLHNPLLFDFVLKRNLRSNGRALAARVFETRGFFL